jgi:hypothetical protein
LPSILVESGPSEDPEEPMPHVEPFSEFLERTKTARPEDYAEALQEAAARRQVSFADQTAEFERMKNFLLGRYEGVAPLSSFSDAAGQTVDCVPFEQQPAVRAARAAGYPVDVAPPPPAAVPGVSPVRAADSERGAECAGGTTMPPGTVPLVRITLDRLIAFGSLDNFFRKGVASPTPGSFPHEKAAAGE